MSAASDSHVTNITHVIFDLDGLLLNTEDIYSEVANELIRRYHPEKTFSWNVKVKMMGRRPNDAIQILLAEMGLPLTIAEYAAESSQMYEKRFSKAKPLPGVERLITHLNSHGIPMSVATGSNVHTYELKTISHRELFSKFFDHVVKSDDPELKHSKPAPDIFLLSASRFPEKPDPSKVLVFEDAPNGVVAALAAGMQVVMIPHVDMDRSLCPKATVLLNSMEDFQPEMFGLPAFNSA